MNYKVTVGIGYTVCKKSQTKYEDVDDCDFQEVSGLCHSISVVMFINY